MAENSQIPTRGYKLLKGQTEQNLGSVLKVGSGLTNTLMIIIITTTTANNNQVRHVVLSSC